MVHLGETTWLYGATIVSRGRVIYGAQVPGRVELCAGMCQLGS